MIKINYDDARNELFRMPDFSSPETVKFKINADFLRFNCWNAAECDRELMVSYFPMLPLLKKEVAFKEADYILFAHPYARVEDMSSNVIEQLQSIDRERKPGAEIIVVGKAANVESLLNGSICNITFYESRFTETLGKRFGMNIKEEYFVYNSCDGCLNIWPVNGCLRKCKFCRRTYMNIPFESLSLETIKAELDYIKNSNPKAMKYIRLRAENLTEYGLDIYGRQRLHDLIDLVDSYEEVEGIDFLIGLAICEMTDEIVDSICKSKKILMVNMNLEVGSNRMLDFIGKDHSRERAIHIFKRVREAHPEAYIASTVMIGFPGEQLTDIYELANLIAQTEPDEVLCNYVGISPKCPLAQFPQLPENLKVYHLKVLLSLLKKQKRKRQLIINYHQIFKKGTRAYASFQKISSEQWKLWSLLYVPKKTLILNRD